MSLAVMLAPLSRKTGYKISIATKASGVRGLTEPLPALGLLEALRSGCGRKAGRGITSTSTVVLRPATESAAPDDAAGPEAATPATGGPAGAEPDLGARFHDRDAVRQPTHPVVDDHR